MLAFIYAALLAIGYATKFSAHYSRRAVLTWAVLGPAFIVMATLALQEVMRSFLRDPANARKTLFAGCTESSFALARRLRHSPDFGMKVHGFFDDRGRERLNLDLDPEVRLLGRLNDLTVAHDVIVGPADDVGSMSCQEWFRPFRWSEPR